MILLQRVLFGVAAGFWLVAGALAALDSMNFDLAGRARGPGRADAGEQGCAGGMVFAARPPDGGRRGACLGCG
jgi:hypothetical protein